MTGRALFRLVLLLAAFLVGAQGAPAQTNQGPAWRLASEAGNLRLYRAAVAAERPAGSAQALQQLDRRMGFPAPGERPRYALPRTFSITPELGYDRNFNGGLDADTVVLGGTEWRITPESRAQPSGYLGARATVGQRFVWARGSVVSLAGQATYRRAVEGRNDYRAFFLQGCSENKIGSYTGFDVCLARSLAYRAHGQSRLTTASAAASRIFVHDNALSQAEVLLARELRPGFGRNIIQVSVRHLNRAHGAFHASMMLGERVVPQSLATLSASIGHGRFINDRFYDLRLRYTEETGGRFAGFRHHRRETAIVLQLPQVIGVIPTVGYHRKRHDLRTFDADYFSFSLSFRSFRF